MQTIMAVPEMLCDIAQLIKVKDSVSFGVGNNSIVLWVYVQYIDQFMGL